MRELEALTSNARALAELRVVVGQFGGLSSLSRRVVQALRLRSATVAASDERYELDEQLECARANVRWIAPLAARRGVTVLIEAVNSFENGPYLVPTTEEADALVRFCDSEHVRLLYDAYHCARQGGDVFAGLEWHRDVIAHVQVADCPGRNEPGTGDIDYTRFFTELGSFYDACVGLEYRPTGGETDASLRWFREVGLLDGGQG